jgi:anthranilate phosphoribosyltransferase
MRMKLFIEKCLEGIDLSVDEASAALELIMAGQASDVEIAGLLVALRAKGETEDELVGFARTMRQHAVKVRVEDPDAIDMCGTGGDGLGTFNISTVASLVVAGAGVTVAKHGNRSVSSKSGSADLLSALGVNVSVSPERVQDCVNEVGVGFLFAPLFHPAMKHAAKPRTELGIRTIFNMLGPITNPGGVRRQLIGTYHQSVATVLAGALRQLEAERACVVHSVDGMDEVTVSGETSVVEVNGPAQLLQYRVSPDRFGLGVAPLEAIRGGGPEENARIARGILDGHRGPARDVVLANAALGLYVAGTSPDLESASGKAAEAIDSGRAREALRKLVEFTERS